MEWTPASRDGIKVPEWKWVKSTKEEKSVRNEDFDNRHRSSLQDEDFLNNHNIRANAYVIKPVGFDELVKAVNAASLFWMVTNQPHQ